MSVDTIIRHAHIHAVCDDVASAATLDAQLAQAAIRLPAQVEALLPGALTLSHGDLAIAIGTLQVNLRIAADAKADAIAAAWAQAIVSAILAELPAVRARPQAAAASSEDAVYNDIWDAECAILRARATQAAMPWWAGEIDPAGIIERWLQREPARATILLLRLLMTEPALLHLLPEAHALRLAMLLRRQLNSRLAELGTMPPTTTLNPPSDPIGSLPIFLDKIASVLDGDLADRLRLLPEGLRALLTLAVVMATQPGRAMALASTPSDMPIQAPDIISAQPVRAVQSLVAANSLNAPGPVTSSDPAPLTEIFGGGLILMLRPLLQLLPPAEINADMLGAIGLAALRRCLLPLPATAARLALERDRPLLAVFAGTPLPDQPLDGIALDSRADIWLDRLIEDMPEAAWAPSTIRRIYGDMEPFTKTPDHARLARLVMRPGLLHATPWSATIVWPMENADIDLRRAGWDIDPGWLPFIGRTIAFRYGDAA